MAAWRSTTERIREGHDDCLLRMASGQSPHPLQRLQPPGQLLLGDLGLPIDPEALVSQEHLIGMLAVLTIRIQPLLEVGQGVLGLEEGAMD